MVSEAEKRRVGALIRSRRQVLGLRQPELAERVGASRQSVGSWETGQSYPLRYVGKIEAVLGVSLTASNITPPPPTDPHERRIWDLAIQDMDAGAAWEVIGEYRRRRRRIA
jgi:transcriptional regulator with XRE-family HTH domain